MNNYNYLLLCTPLGKKYTRRIADNLRTFGNRVYIYTCYNVKLAFKNHPEWNSNNLIIHSRAANPQAPWIDKLFELQSQGYRIINSPELLSLTSDKYNCYKYLNFYFSLPKTFLLEKRRKLKKESVEKITTDFVIIKPRYSRGGGKFVERIPTEEFINANNKGELYKYTESYSCSSIVQEYINYLGIARIFCVNKIALPPETWDSPTENNWKVSVCLNKKQLPYIPKEYPRDLIREYAVDIQNSLGGEINFIDVFWTESGPMLSEINTACSLLTHERITEYNIAGDIARYLNLQKKDRQ